MKKCLLALLILLVASPVWAQNRTVIRRQNQLKAPQQSSPVVAPVQPAPVRNEQAKWVEEGQLVNREFQHGYFVAPAFKFSQVNETFGLLAGGRVGWILNHRYAFGLGGYGLLNNVEAPSLTSGVKPDMMMSYGGLEFEYFLYPADLVHFSVSTLLGIGQAEYDYTVSDGDDTFWIVEPGVNVWVNVTPFFKAALGASYRIASGVEMEGLKDGDLGGFVTSLIFNLGSF